MPGSNKTSFKTGVSGNPKGRPPKSRALTDILATAGNAKADNFDGKPEARKKVLAEMIWSAALSGQVRFMVGNRTDSLARGPRPVERVDEVDYRSWWIMATWLYHQIDGDLSVLYNDSAKGDPDETPATGDDQAPIIYIPDNARQSPPETPKTEEGSETGEGAEPS